MQRAATRPRHQDNAFSEAAWPHASTPSLEPIYLCLKGDLPATTSTVLLFRYLPYLCSILSQSLLITRYLTKCNRTLASRIKPLLKTDLPPRFNKCSLGSARPQVCFAAPSGPRTAHHFTGMSTCSLWTKGNSLFPLLDESFSRMGWKSDKVITRLL